VPDLPLFTSRHDYRLGLRGPLPCRARADTPSAVIAFWRRFAYPPPGRSATPRASAKRRLRSLLSPSDRNALLPDPALDFRGTPFARLDRFDAVSTVSGGTGESTPVLPGVPADAGGLAGDLRVDAAHLASSLSSGPARVLPGFKAASVWTPHPCCLRSVWRRDRTPERPTRSRA